MPKKKTGTAAASRKRLKRLQEGYPKAGGGFVKKVSKRAATSARDMEKVRGRQIAERAAGVTRGAAKPAVRKKKR